MLDGAKSTAREVVNEGFLENEPPDVIVSDFSNESEIHQNLQLAFEILVLIEVVQQYRFATAVVVHPTSLHDDEFAGRRVIDEILSHLFEQGRPDHQQVNRADTRRLSASCQRV